jgi:acetoacetate decarboxylase
VNTINYDRRGSGAPIVLVHGIGSLAQARAEITAPTSMLKIVPGYDGEPRIAELVRSQITEIMVKGVWMFAPTTHISLHRNWSRSAWNVQIS